MIKSISIISLLTTAALAQSSSSSPSTTGAASPAIPTGISTDCQQFLQSLDSNQALTTCLKAFNTATAPFAPGTASSNTPNADSVSTTLTNICSDSFSTSCPDNVIRSSLATFYTKCPAELTSSNKEVSTYYDILFAILPTKEAVCSKDDSGQWCAMSSKSSNPDVLSAASKYLAINPSSLSPRADVVTQPNMTTFHDSRIPFLFISPNLDSTSLCTPCTRSVLMAFINWESDMQYGSGINNSMLLNNQPDLISDVQDKCGKNFLSGAVQAAGGLGTFGPTSGASSFVREFQGIGAFVVGMMTLAISFAT